MNPTVLLVAKAPVPGQVKTRLGVAIGMAEAARIAAAALLDTIAACADAFGAEHCHLALAGDLAWATDGEEIAETSRSWARSPQRGVGLAERLAHAHLDAGPGPLLQVGMDTPHLTGPLLREVADGLADHDAVLGAAEDGGWWVLGARHATAAAALRGVPMSTPETGRLTRDALEATGLSVGTAVTLRDVDTVEDAEAVAALAPAGRFAAAWRAYREARA